MYTFTANAGIVNNILAIYTDGHDKIHISGAITGVVANANTYTPLGTISGLTVGQELPCVITDSIGIPVGFGVIHITSGYMSVISNVNIAAANQVVCYT